MNRRRTRDYYYLTREQADRAVAYAALLGLMLLLLFSLAML